jgi:hypothetical protein
MSKVGMLVGCDTLALNLRGLELVSHRPQDNYCARKFTSNTRVFFSEPFCDIVTSLVRIVQPYRCSTVSA